MIARLCSALFLTLGVLEAVAPVAIAAAPEIRPGDVWFDDRGKQIQAHGGGIIRHAGRYYWFGEDRSPENDPRKRYVACYSSGDLTKWSFCGQSLVLENPENLGDTFVLERPKVFHNKTTGKFVMYMHLDRPKPGGGGYQLARVAVAVSDTIAGPYTYVRSFRPLGKESRDIGQFIDDDGTAYLIFESRPSKGFYIASLSADYMDVEKEIAFIQAPIEGGAIVHHKGLYYVIGSHLTGWLPNPNVYATAKKLSGPWSKFRDIAPPQTKSFASQSSNLIKVQGTSKTTIVYVGDRWFPDRLWDSRYIWMPLQIEDGNLSLPKPEPWTIDVRTGNATRPLRPQISGLSGWQPYTRPK